MKYLLISLLVFIANLSSNELSWVDEQVAAIKPKRVGVSKADITSLKDPFIIYKTVEKIDKNGKKSTVLIKKDLPELQLSSNDREPEIKLVLQAIMNSSVLINGKWYRLNDKIGRYRLKDIKSSLVILMYKKERLVLSTDNLNKNLKFKN